MRRLTRRQWRIADDTVRVLGADVGRTPADLASMLGAEMADLRASVGLLYGPRRIDHCTGYLGLPAHAEGRRAA
jgi:hypothetical protein